jgi:heat shock protein HslJ
MTMRTRTSFLGIAIATVALAACTSSGGGSSASSAAGGAGGELTGKTWVLSTYEQDGTRKEVPAGVVVDATFDGTASTVSGTGGCNRYNGSYTVSGSNLTFGLISSTEMACEEPAMGVEGAYLANLATVKTFTATEDSLTLHDADGTAILAYAAAAAGTLDGVTWHATGINNGQQAVVSVADGTDPTMVYDAAGTISGNAGCNTYSGAAVVDGSSIEIGPLMSTKMACADDAANTQETAFLAALENATTVELVGTHLELRDAEGALQVSFEAR